MQMVRVLFVFKSIRVIYANSVFLACLYLYFSFSVHFGLFSECHIVMVTDLFCSLFVDWLADFTMLPSYSPQKYSFEFLCSQHTHTTKWWKFGFQMQITAVGRNWIIIKDYWIGFFVDKCSCSKTNPTKCVTKLVFCFSTISFYVYFFLLQRLW